MQRELSRRLYERAMKLMPGGVSSPVRAFKPYPSYIRCGRGSKIVDVDGNEYIDYCMGFGPLILGHADPDVVSAVRAQSELGFLYGTPIEQEIEMAELIRNHYPSVEMIRIVNTGTEATMHAIRVARGFTGRKKIVKIEGGFHGAHDSVLVKAGSGATTHSIPNSLGIPEEVTANTLLVPYNDLSKMKETIRRNREEIAALIIEPVLGNTGPVLPVDGYLEGIRELTEENDILLIFDEVITGFRLAMGGAQELYGVTPDMTVLGKIAGGGLPIGIFGGPEEIMKTVSPAGKVYQAGTFSGNPMSLVAGLATIKKLQNTGHEELNARGDMMKDGLTRILEDLQLPYVVQGIGSMFQLFLTDRRVVDYASAKTCDTELFNRLFLTMLEKGIFLPPSQFETSFLSTAHSHKDIEFTLNMYATSLQEVTG